MAGPTRWGILGTGFIAGELAQALSRVEDAELVAVGSRRLETANAFADRFRIEGRHGSYQALVEDPSVDIVYVATPHGLHHSNTLSALDAGKGVLCEKPLALSHEQGQQMVARAREQGCFLMEAMWTRFFPLLTRLRSLVDEGALGELRLLEADFGFRAEPEPGSHLFDPSFGGGALLDVGVYPVFLASMLFGEPERVAALAELGPTSVEDQIASVLSYAGGALAVLHAAIRTETPQRALLCGTKARVEIHPPWWRPSSMTITRYGPDDISEHETVEVPYSGSGYEYEVQEVIACVRGGRLESEAMPLSESLALLRTLDRIRECIPELAARAGASTTVLDGASG